MVIFCLDWEKKSKTETSLLLNKLSQLKEKTSSKLSDLLKKSPVRYFKDFPEHPSTSHSNSTHDIYHTQSIVGRRLSHCDNLLPAELSCLKQESDDNASSFTLTPDQDSLNTPVKTIETKISDEISDTESLIPPLPPKLHISNRSSYHDSTISLSSTNPGTLERSTESRQGYSTDNLADVEENDYVNVDYGDHSVVQCTKDEKERIYEVIPCNTQTKQIESVANDEAPPELPPLPEFLLRKRLEKRNSDSEMMQSKEVVESAAVNRLSLPGDMKLNRPTSEFWIALQKYMDTGTVDGYKNKKSHRPLRHSDGSVGSIAQRESTNSCR